MIKVPLTDGTTLNVSFHHKHASSQTKGEKPILFTHQHPSGRGVFNSAHYTQATIYTGATKEDKVILSTGNAICSLKDNFDKREGKRLSLERALEKTNYSKEDRTAIWTAFRIAFPDNKMREELMKKKEKSAAPATTPDTVTTEA